MNIVPKDIDNLIGNVYQSIGGSHYEKCKIIGQWIDCLRKVPSSLDGEKLVHIVVDDKDYKSGDI